MTYIYEKVSENDFLQAFVQRGRGESFSYEGQKALFEYLEQYAEDTGEAVELDVIALCCEYSEYESLAAFKNEYGGDHETFDDIERETQVIYTGDYQDEDAPFIVLAF